MPPIVSPSSRWAAESPTAAVYTSPLGPVARVEAVSTRGRVVYTVSILRAGRMASVGGGLTLDGAYAVVEGALAIEGLL
jgi:hypothetical protein